MPRKPTGRPRGRQLGSGALGLGTQDAHTRLTLRIPNDLYTRLEAFAEGRAYTRGTPHLARCVRDAVEHYLACPHKRQTSSVPPVPVDTWQTSNGTPGAEDNIRQTSNCVEGREDNTGQTINVPVKGLGTREYGIEQTVNVLEEDTTETEHDIWQTANNATPVPLATTDLDASPLGESVAIAPQPAQPALDYDRTKYVLGRLCPRGHDYQGTGQTLLLLPRRRCLPCENERKREKRQTTRPTPVT